MSSQLEPKVTAYPRGSLCASQAVRLVADLCLEYQVYDPQLWNSLLQKLLSFNLVSTRYGLFCIFLFSTVNVTRIRRSTQISHLQGVLEAVVSVPALWEVKLHLMSSF